MLCGQGRTPGLLSLMLRFQEAIESSESTAPVVLGQSDRLEVWAESHGDFASFVERLSLPRSR